MRKLNLKDLESEDPKIKYCFAKEAILISKENPSSLYGDFDVFVSLLSSKKNVLKWTALQVLGNLSSVDSKKKIDKLVPRLINFLNSGELITASNAILGLTTVAENKPKYKDKILKEFLKVENYTYYNKGEVSPECRNIVIGNVIKVIEKFKDYIKNKKIFIDFLVRQESNTRTAVAKRAEALLDKLKRA